MKAYINYMDSLSVDPELHKKIMEGLSSGAVHRPTITNKRCIFVPVAIGAAAVFTIFFGGISHLNGEEPQPHDGQPIITGAS